MCQNTQGNLLLAGSRKPPPIPGHPLRILSCRTLIYDLQLPSSNSIALSHLDYCRGFRKIDFSGHGSSELKANGHSELHRLSSEKIIRNKLTKTFLKR